MNQSDEKQGFRTERSCIDAVIVKQITEKALEFYKPTDICFVTSFHMYIFKYYLFIFTCWCTFSVSQKFECIYI